MAHVREKPPLRLALDVVTPTGRHYRWGEDEPDPAYVFRDLRHSSTMPGGYESCDLTLPRKPGIDYSDLERLSTIRILGAGGGVVGEYRLERAPRVSGDELAVSPSAVGWQAHLDDDKSALEIYRDIDLSHWGEQSTTHYLAQVASAYAYLLGPTLLADEGGTPSLRIGWEGAWLASAIGARSWAMYDAHNIGIGSVYYGWRRESTTNVDPANTNWNWQVILSDDNARTNTQTSGNLRAAGPGTGTVSANATRRYAFLIFAYDAVPGGADGLKYGTLWSRLAVYGTHGLTLRGTEPNAGFYASDIVAHAVQRWAPLLNIKPDSVEPSGFLIPHLVFREPTTAGDIVRQASRFSLPDWGVWGGREFQWGAPGGKARRWRARSGPTRLQETGPQLDRLWESVLVQYQDVDGTTRTVGPPASGADTEDAALKSYDPANPANQLGITRRDLLQMGISTAAGATEVGRLFLEQSQLLNSSGQATLTGWVESDRGVLHPYYDVRAGDEIAFVDAADKSYRRIVRADHGRDSRTCTVDLDSPPEGLAGLLERLDVVLVPLGL